MVLFGGKASVFTIPEGLLTSGSLGKAMTHNEFALRYLSMSARGTLKYYGSCMSLILGMLSTHTYMQFILSAKGDKEAKSSLIWASLIVLPPVGIAGSFIGMLMRSHYIIQSEVNALISAIITEDVMSILKHKLLFSCLTVALTLSVVALIANVFPANAINDLGFLSMTLRASVVFMPLTCALLLKGKVKGSFIIASIILAPLSAVMSVIAGLSVEPLSVLICASGLSHQKSRAQR